MCLLMHLFHMFVLKLLLKVSVTVTQVTCLTLSHVRSKSFFVLGEGHIKLDMARHPCLEVQDDVAFIANDLKLERGTVKRPKMNERV